MKREVLYSVTGVKDNGTCTVWDTYFIDTSVFGSMNECNSSFFTSACCKAMADELMAGTDSWSRMRLSMGWSGGSKEPLSAFSNSSWASLSHCPM